ncbi:hypothetical protein OROMI_011596 [Orobanche minor]
MRVRERNPSERERGRVDSRITYKRHPVRKTFKPLWSFGRANGTRSGNMHRATFHRDSDTGRFDTNGWVTFFIRNLPKECSKDRLENTLSKIGKVVDLFRPKKTDKSGNEFGFVRFKAESDADVDRLLEDANNLWIDSYRLMVYIPRFNKEHAIIKRSEPVIVSSRKREEGVSYKDVFGNIKEGEKRVEETEIPITFSSKEEDSAWLKDSLVGLLKDEYDWEEHEEELKNEVANSTVLRTLGDNLVLIQVLKKSNGKTVDMKDWFGYWFKWVRPWKSDDVSFRRRVWTSWMGVPCQAWCLDFSKKASMRFGSFIKMDPATEKKERLDVARIKLRVNAMKEANATIRATIDGKTFVIRVVEENPDEGGGGVWSGSEEESESESDSDSECGEDALSDFLVDATWSEDESEAESDAGNFNVLALPEIHISRNEEIVNSLDPINQHREVDQPEGNNGGENVPLPDSQSDGAPPGWSHVNLTEEVNNGPITSNGPSPDSVSGDCEFLGRENDSSAPNEAQIEEGPGIIATENVEQIGTRVEEGSSFDVSVNSKDCSEGRGSESVDLRLGNPIIDSSKDIRGGDLTKKKKIPKKVKKAEELKRMGSFFLDMSPGEPTRREEGRPDMRGRANRDARHSKKEAKAIRRVGRKLGLIEAASETDIVKSIAALVEEKRKVASGSANPGWNENAISVRSWWSMEGAVVLNGEWIDKNCEVVLINVYAPCDDAGKKDLWDRIGLVVKQNTSACI